VSDTVKVEIFDHTYHLRGDLDQAHADELARYVDARMRTIAEGTRTVDSVRVAVLASLHIAAELFDLRERHKALEGEIRERAERALTLVDRAFEKTA
jgi:cell division protein ZapA (FtsZ GTPase activity inhibitor)